MQKLSGYQRASLLRQAHHLSAVATVGKNGDSEMLHRHVDEELENHELIKVRFADFKDIRRTVAERLATGTRAHLVKVIGHVAVLYRPAREPDRRRVVVPERG